MSMTQVRPYPIVFGGYSLYQDEPQFYPSFHLGSLSSHQTYPDRSRDRIIMACVHCRKRKSKCDGAQPGCKPCARAGRSCRYEAVSEAESWMAKMRKKRDRTRKAQADAERDQERSRAVLFQSMLNAHSQPQPSTSAPACPCCPPPPSPEPRTPNAGLDLFLDGPLSPMTAASEASYSSLTTPGDTERDRLLPDWLLLQTPASLLPTPASTPDLVSSAATAWLTATPSTDAGQDLFSPQWHASSTLDAAMCLTQSNTKPYLPPFY